MKQKHINILCCIAYLGAFILSVQSDLFAPNYSRTCSDCFLDDNHILRCNCLTSDVEVPSYGKYGYISASLDLDANIGEQNKALVYGDSNYSKSNYVNGCRLTGPTGQETTGIYLLCTKPSTSLDLNTYIGNNSGQLTWFENKYAGSCKYCSLISVPAKNVTGIPHILLCSCKDKTGLYTSSLLDLDNYIGESGGKLIANGKNFSSSNYFKDKTCGLKGTILACGERMNSIDLNSYISSNSSNGTLHFD